MSLLDTINAAHNGIIDTVHEWISEGISEGWILFDNHAECCMFE